MKHIQQTLARSNPQYYNLDPNGQAPLHFASIFRTIVEHATASGALRFGRIGIPTEKIKRRSLSPNFQEFDLEKIVKREYWLKM